MLFDLRGRGRRRTVQGIYLGLAVLMGGGLVLFGVGGTGVGLFNNNNGNTSGGGSSTSARLSSARRAVKAHPQDPRAWLELARRVAQNADTDVNTGLYTAKGRKELPEAATAWERYLALKPKQIDPSGASVMAGVFDTDGLNRPKDRTVALQAVAAARPSLGTYRNLALSAYGAGLTRIGDLASQKALDLAPTKSSKALVRTQLDQAKKQGAGASAGTGATGGATTTTP